MIGGRRLRRHRFELLMAACAVALALGVALIMLFGSPASRIVGLILVAGAWIGPVLFAVRYQTRASFRNVAKERDLRVAQRATADSLRQAREEGKQSANHQKRALSRIEEQVRQVLSLSQAHMAPGAPHAIDVLFVTSNGAGLGHISRLLAISRELSADITAELLTLSSAYRRAAHQGMTVHYFPSSEASGQNARVWNQHFRAYLYQLLGASRPRVVVFDGTWVYAALADICRSFGIPVVWVQRGMWKAEADKDATQRRQAHRVADHVLVPGDYAGEEIIDAGGKVEVSQVGPITMTTRSDLKSRLQACNILGLDPAREYVLLNLGGGSLGESEDLTRSVISHLRRESPEMHPVVLRSPLSRQSADGELEGCTVVEAYPLMPLIKAFEYMVCAAGYNAAQEAVGLGVPAILIPNILTRTDDQLARAQGLARQNLCLVATDEPTLRQAVMQLAGKSYRQQLRDRLRQVPAPQGAREAARFLESEIEDASWTGRAVTLRVQSSAHSRGRGAS